MLGIMLNKKFTVSLIELNMSVGHKKIIFISDSQVIHLPHTKLVLS